VVEPPNERDGPTDGGDVVGRRASSPSGIKSYKQLHAIFDRSR